MVPNHPQGQESREQRSCNTDTNYYGDRVCISTPDNQNVARKPSKANTRPASSSRAEGSDAVAEESAETLD
jgi:hypothetical protein